jgi:methylated-DNA-[protein]-cysteine S-methyltransferase
MGLHMGKETFYTTFKTPAGWVGLAGSSLGLCRLILPQPTEKKVLTLLLDGFQDAVPSSDMFKDLTRRLLAYFSGKQIDFPDNLDYGDATPFQCRIWEAARKIPYGKTHTYAWVAAQAGKPKAVRAVGQALGRNPLPIIVPCHRVTCTGGGLGGFSAPGGTATKENLLKLENQKRRDRQLSMNLD